jgi:hypothetical protein
VLSGCTSKCSIDNTYCHYATPRAKIFRSQQADVRSIQDVQALLQYNHYSTDVYSKKDSCKVRYSTYRLSYNIPFIGYCIPRVVFDVVYMFTCKYLNVRC